MAVCQFIPSVCVCVCVCVCVGTYLVETVSWNVVKYMSWNNKEEIGTTFTVQQWRSLYMFRTVFPSIIRSSRLYTQRHLYVIHVSWLLASGPVMEFHLLPASMHSTNLYDIYMTLCVQSWTPDDGRKDRPKRVEWFSINAKIVHLVGFAIELYQDARSHKSLTRKISFTKEHLNNPIILGMIIR